MVLAEDRHMFTVADASTACTDDGGAGVGAGCGDDTKEVGGAGDEAESDILLALAALAPLCGVWV